MRYEAYSLLCDLYEKSGKLDSAFAICQQLILLKSTDYRNIVRSAEILMQQKKTDAAIQTLYEARIKFPAEAEVTYALGLALTDVKRYAERYRRVRGGRP